MDKTFFEDIGLIIMKYGTLTADAQHLDSADNLKAANRIKKGVSEIKVLQKQFDNKLKQFKVELKATRKQKNIDSPRKKGSNIQENLKRKHST